MDPSATKALQRWLVPALILIGMITAWWLVVVPRQLSAAEAEAEVHDHMEKSGASPDELCAQAKIVERAFVREGDAKRIEDWAMKRKIECLNAYACSQIIGGCMSR